MTSISLKGTRQMKWLRSNLILLRSNSILVQLKVPCLKMIHRHIQGGLLRINQSQYTPMESQMIIRILEQRERQFCYRKTQLIKLKSRVLLELYQMMILEINILHSLIQESQNGVSLKKKTIMLIMIMNIQKL